MDYSNSFISPSGNIFYIEQYYKGHAEGRDAFQNSLSVSSAISEPLKVDVVFPTPKIISDFLDKEFKISFESERDELAVLAVLSEIDSSPNIIENPERKHEILANQDALTKYLKRNKFSDRDMRRYIVRKVYDSYSRKTLYDDVKIEKIDYWITGSEPIDFMRNTQVLDEEEYLRVHDPFAESDIIISGRAKLVREFEKYGAARDDVIAKEDYESTLKNYNVLKNSEEAILLEYKRYSNSIGPLETISVFRSIAPIVEQLLRELLKSHDCNKDLPTLGPMISELRQRKLGSAGLYSQINHILKFARDLSQHGNDVPLSVLRIACQNAFELVPQIASLFP